MKLSDTNVLLSNSSLICRDTENKIDCQPILSQNKLIKYDDYNTNVYINKNTLICDDVDNLDTCICLKHPCEYFNKLLTINVIGEQIKYYNFISTPITFSPNDGLYFVGRLLPIPINTNPSNSFSLSFFINISKIDVAEYRSLFSYGDMFNISIAPYNSNCSSKLYIQLKSLDAGGIFDGSCDKDMDYFKWCHIVIQGSGNVLNYYFNGYIGQQIVVKENYKLGRIDDYIIIGKNCPGISVSDMYWFNSMINQNFIDWEWVILDDSPDENHFNFLKNYIIILNYYF